MEYFWNIVGAPWKMFSIFSGPRLQIVYLLRVWGGEGLTRHDSAQSLLAWIDLDGCTRAPRSRTRKPPGAALYNHKSRCPEASKTKAKLAQAVSASARHVALPWAPLDAKQRPLPGVASEPPWRAKCRCRREETQWVVLPTWWPSRMG